MEGVNPYSKSDFFSFGSRIFMKERNQASLEPIYFVESARFCHFI